MTTVSSRSAPVNGKNSPDIGQSITPTLAEIEAIAKRQPGFLGRVDQAIRTAYELRQLRRHGGDHPAVKRAIEALEKLTAEGLDEWFYSTRSERYHL